MPGPSFGRSILAATSHPGDWKFYRDIGKRMNKKECSEKYLVRAGIGMVALVLLTVLMVTALLLILAYRIHPVAGVILE